MLRTKEIVKLLHTSLIPEAHAQKRPRVYVAGPISGGSVLEVLENINRGNRVGVELMLRGYAPFVPFHDFMHSMTIRQDRGERLTVEDYYGTTIEYIQHCQALYVVPTADGYGGKWQDSTGTAREIHRAMYHEVPVILGDYDVLQYVAGTSQAESNRALARLRDRGRIERLHGVYWFDGYPEHSDHVVEELNEWYGKGFDQFKAQ